MINIIIFCENEADQRLLAPIAKVRSGVKIYSFNSVPIVLGRRLENCMIILVLDEYKTDVISDLDIEDNIECDLFLLADLTSPVFIRDQFRCKAELIQKSPHLLAQILYIIRNETHKKLYRNYSIKLMAGVGQFKDADLSENNADSLRLLEHKIKWMNEFRRKSEDWLINGGYHLEERNFNDVMDQTFARLEPLLTGRTEIQKNFGQMGMVFCDESILIRSIISIIIKLVDLNPTFRRFIFTSSLTEGIRGVQESVLSLKIGLDQSAQIDEKKAFLQKMRNSIESDFDAILTISSHLGEVVYQQDEPDNTLIEIRLPSHSLFRRNDSLEPLSGRNKIKTILVVDDEEIIRELIIDVLPVDEYRVLTGADGEEGLKLFIKHQHDIDLVILDVVMPKMDGRKLYDEIQKINTTVKVVITSGYSKANVRDKLALSAVDAFFPKPFIIEDLIELLKKLLG